MHDKTTISTHTSDMQTPKPVPLLKRLDTSTQSDASFSMFSWSSCWHGLSPKVLIASLEKSLFLSKILRAATSRSASVPVLQSGKFHVRATSAFSYFSLASNIRALNSMFSRTVCAMNSSCCFCRALCSAVSSMSPFVPFGLTPSW